MVRRRDRKRVGKVAEELVDAPPGPSPPRNFWTRPRVVLAVALMLTIHVALAVLSLTQENPTVDEVTHLPAGVTYWQKGTFRLYPHNPPLVKLYAAAPVVLSRPQMAGLYESKSWTSHAPSQAMFGHLFAYANAERYFELFARARLMMLLFPVIGGLVVFAWSRRLYGDAGGLLSLALWCACPNVLAHGRLVTSDLAATALGVGATYTFWLYLRRPTWRMAAVAGVILGVAELSKFSLLLLYFVWPFLWLVREAIVGTWAGRARRVIVSAAQGVFLVALSILVIDLGYGFEDVGVPLGDFPFVSMALTRPRAKLAMNLHENDLLRVALARRENLFRGTPLEDLPAPLPRHYLAGFDEQKIEAEGIPRGWIDSANPDSQEMWGYPVYLDGVMRHHGWARYYAMALLYKIPEGTWAIGLLAVIALFARRSREAWADEIMVATVPAVVLVTMTFLTDINLGLRYVLPVLPYGFIAAGKVVPWAGAMRPAARRALRIAIGAALTATIAATASIHPHYLAYFNWASGGPDRSPPHLIDSNLDWGQDLVGLRRWLDEHPEETGSPIGLAYFGQINPSLFALRGDGFLWFVPPPVPGTAKPQSGDGSNLVGPPARLKPGLYAISASLAAGLPWRIYDPAPLAWLPAWSLDKNRQGDSAYGYFQELGPPFDQIGHSILLYRVSVEDAERLAPIWDRSAEAP